MSVAGNRGKLNLNCCEHAKALVDLGSDCLRMVEIYRNEVLCAV